MILIDTEKTVWGGKFDSDTLQIEPTLLDRATFKDAVMQEEIFGPVLPIVTYDSLDHAIAKINSMPHPLALYLFTSDQRLPKKSLRGAVLVADASMMLSFTLPQVKWDSADSEKVAWALITERTVLTRSPTIKAL